MAQLAAAQEKRNRAVHQKPGQSSLRGQIALANNEVHPIVNPRVARLAKGWLHAFADKEVNKVINN